jgi:hypothetical protein
MVVSGLTVNDKDREARFPGHTPRIDHSNAGCCDSFDCEEIRQRSTGIKDKLKLKGSRKGSCVFHSKRTKRRKSGRYSPKAKYGSDLFELLKSEAVQMKTLVPKVKGFHQTG